MEESKKNKIWMIFSIVAIIVIIVFASCSIESDFAVTSIFPFPLKYPFKTDSIATIKIEGANTFNTSFVSGISKYSSAMASEKKYKAQLPINPIVPNIAIDTFKTLYAPLLSPTANLADIKLAIALGIPIEHTVKNMAYTWNAAENIALPVSAYPVLFVKYNLYTIPITFIIACENNSINTFFKKLFFFKPNLLLFKYIYVFCMFRPRIFERNYVNFIIICIFFVFLLHKCAISWKILCKRLVFLPIL